MIDNDIHATSSNISSLNKILEPDSGSVDCPEINLDSHATKLTPTDVTLPTSLPSSLHSDEIENPDRDESSNKYVDLKDNASVNDTLRLDTSRVESRTNLNTRSNQEDQKSYTKNLPKLPLSRQQGSSYHVQGFQGQRISQGMNHLENFMEKFPHGHPNFSVELQPSFHAPGFTPPLYATESAYMASGNPFYPNLQPSSLYAPQYSLTGYTMGSTLLPPMMAGYPSHGALPVPFGATSSPSFIGQTAGLPTGEGIPHVGDVQHQSEFFGRAGSMLQPSFVNPLQMQYYPHSAHDIYGNSVQHGQLASRGIIGSPFTHEVSTFSAYTGDQKFQSLTNGNMSISTPRKMGISGNGNSPFMGVMTQFPPSPLASPIMPSSPVGGANHLGRHTEMRFTQGSIRSPGIYTGLQGNRGFNSADDQKKPSFLEEIKSSNSPRKGLSDIEGRIVEFRHCSSPWLLVLTKCSCITISYMKKIISFLCLFQC